MTEKSIETRIREHYTAQNGEWLIESGKVKEAKLLKEACETIETLRRHYAQSEKNYYSILKSTSEKERELKEREKSITEREEKFETRKAIFIREFEKFV